MEQSPVAEALFRQCCDAVDLSVRIALAAGVLCVVLTAVLWVVANRCGENAGGQALE